MVLLSTLVNHTLWEHATEFHDELKLLLLVISWEERFTGKEFSKDASKRPDIDFFGVRDPKNDFWGTVVSRLDVSVNLLMSQAPGAKVNDLKQSASWVDTEDILRFQVAVNHFALLEEDESFE